MCDACKNVHPLYLRYGPTTFCPWCRRLVRTFERATHLKECDRRPAWIAVM